MYALIQRPSIPSLQRYSVLRIKVSSRGEVARCRTRDWSRGVARRNSELRGRFAVVQQNGREGYIFSKMESKGDENEAPQTGNEAKRPVVCVL